MPWYCCRKVRFMIMISIPNKRDMHGLWMLTKILQPRIDPILYETTKIINPDAIPYWIVYFRWISWSNHVLNRYFLALLDQYLKIALLSSLNWCQYCCFINNILSETTMLEVAEMQPKTTAKITSLSYYC